MGMGMIEWIINGDFLGRNNQRTQDINRDDMIMSSLLGAGFALTSCAKLVVELHRTERVKKCMRLDRNLT